MPLTESQRQELQELEFIDQYEQKFIKQYEQKNGIADIQLQPPSNPAASTATAIRPPTFEQTPHPQLTPEQVEYELQGRMDRPNEPDIPYSGQVHPDYLGFAKSIMTQGEGEAVNTTPPSRNVAEAFSRGVGQSLLNFMAPPEPAGGYKPLDRSKYDFTKEAERKAYESELYSRSKNRYDAAQGMRNVASEVSLDWDSQRKNQAVSQNIAQGVGGMALYMNPFGHLVFASDIMKHPEMAVELVRAVPEAYTTFGKAIGGDKEAIQTLKTHGFETSMGALLPIAVALGFKGKVTPGIKSTVKALGAEAAKAKQLVKAVGGKSEFYRGKGLAERIKEPFQQDRSVLDRFPEQPHEGVIDVIDGKKPRGERTIKNVPPPLVKPVEKAPVVPKTDASVLKESAKAPIKETTKKVSVPTTLEVEASKPLVQVYSEYSKTPEVGKIKQTKSEPQDVIGLNKEEISSIRSTTGLDQLPEPDVRKWSFVLEEAKRGKHDTNAEGLATQIIGDKETGLKPNPRTITDAEHAGMIIKINELQNAYEADIASMTKSLEKGNQLAADAARFNSDVLLSRIDKLTAASDMSGREIARALNARKMLINRQTFDLVSMVRKGSAAKGRKLSDVEVGKYKEFADKYKESQKVIDEVTKKYQESMAREEQLLAEKVFLIESNKSKIRKTTTESKKSNLQDRVNIKKELAGLGYKVHEAVVGLPAQASYLVGRLATSYIKDGVATLSGVMKRVKADMPALSDRDIWRALNEKNPKLQKKAELQTTKNLRHIKTQARLLDELADINDGIFKEPGKRKPSPKDIQIIQKKIKEEKLQKRLIEEIDKAQKGELPVTKKRGIESPKITILRKQLKESRQKTVLLDKIEKAQRGIFDKTKKGTPSPLEIRMLQKKLREIRRQAFRTTIKTSRLEKAMETLAHLEDALANHYRDIKAKRKIDDAALQDVKRRISDVRSQMRVEDEILRLQEMIKNKDFELPISKEPKNIPPELERAQVALKRLRQDVRDYTDALRPPTAGDYFWKSVNTMRTIKATADMSYALRQGAWISARRPKMAGKAFGKAAKAAFGEEYAHKIDNAIREHPYYYIAERAKLSLTELGKSLSGHEEHFMNNFLEDIYGLKHIVRGSERNMVTGLNLLRFGAFCEFLARYPNATRAELTAWADYINAATGRAKMGGNVAKGLSLVFFAPRFAWSRVTTPFKIIQYRKLPRVRNEIAKDIAAVASVGAMTLGLATWAGWEVGSDPRKSDFGKVKVGNSVFDIYAGFQQPMRQFFRLGVWGTDTAGLTGEELSKSEIAWDFAGDISRFATYKWAPLLTTTHSIVAGKTIVGEPMETVGDFAAQLLTPMVYDDIFKAYQDGGLGRGIGVTAASFLGVGANTYQKSIKNKKFLIK